jgi:hypothetical protein
MQAGIDRVLEYWSRSQGVVALSSVSKDSLLSLDGRTPTMGLVSPELRQNIEMVTVMP